MVILKVQIEMYQPWWGGTHSIKWRIRVLEDNDSPFSEKGKNIGESKYHYGEVTNDQFKEYIKLLKEAICDAEIVG